MMKFSVNPQLNLCKAWGLGMMIAIVAPMITTPLLLTLPAQAQVRGQYALQSTCPTPPPPGGIPCYTPETAPILRRNSRGRKVEDWQNFLRQMGYFEGPTTGFYGSLTEASVRQFQRASGLTPDGVVGPNAWRAFIAANAD